MTRLLHVQALAARAIFRLPFYHGSNSLQTNMRKIRVLLTVIALGSVTLSCSIFKGFGGSKTSVDPPQLVKFDPAKDEPVSPGADGYANLREIDPDVPDLAAKVEEAERSAIRKMIAELSAKQNASAAPITIRIPALRSETNLIHGTRPIAMSMMFTGESGPNFEGRKTVAGVITMMVGVLKGLMSGWAGGTEGATNKQVTETKNGVTSTMGMELKLNKDGTSTFGIKIKSEVPGQGEVEFTGRIEGTDCPDASGEVNLDVNTRISAISGGSGYTQDLKGTIKAIVGDDANIESSVMDLNQGTREVRKGKGTYLETSYTLTRDGEKYNVSNWKVERSSQDALNDIPLARKSVESGEYSVLSTAVAALEMAKYHWQEGGCVQIEAKSPGKVAVNSVTPIPVKVTHKIDGSEVPSKLESTLEGGASIDPAVIPKTAGTLNYTAPGETNKKAVIKLKATSRRGIAKLDLNASTGSNSYRVNASSNGVSFKGEICDAGKAFNLDAKFPGGTAVVTFSPGGSTATNGGGNGCKMAGSGSYTLDGKPDGGAMLNWTSSDTLTCPMFSNSRSTSFSVALEPAPDLKCP